MAAKTRLNPNAPEFFLSRPHFYCPLSPPLISNYSIYYSVPPLLASSRLHFSQIPPYSDDHLIPADTQPLHEPPVAVSPSGGKRGRGWCTKRNTRGCGYYSKKRLWRPKRDVSNGNKSNRQKNPKSSQGGNNPVLAVELNGQNTTTCMIKNIPNRYTRELLMELLDEHCKKENEKEGSSVAAYDFLYLPIDFQSKANKGYGFVNFTNPEGLMRLKRAMNNKRWPLFLSNKVCSIADARVQGREEQERHFGGSVFECESDDYLPVSFRPARDGSKTTCVEQKLIGTRLGDLN